MSTGRWMTPGMTSARARPAPRRRRPGPQFVPECAVPSPERENYPRRMDFNEGGLNEAGVHMADDRPHLQGAADTPLRFALVVPAAHAHDLSRRHGWRERRTG